MPLLEFLLMLTFLVVIHELGHFITARLFKVKIEEFGIGYPPHARTLFHWKGIPFTLNWIPVGGFVRMEGEDGGEVTKPHVHNTIGPFYGKPKWQRLIVILAGATVNFLFGVLAFTLIYSKIGIPTPISPVRTVIVELHDGPGKDAGLLVDDQIVAAVDSAHAKTDVGDPTAFTAWIRARPDTDITFTVKRSGEVKDIKLHTRKKEEIESQGAISVTLGVPIVAKFYPWYQMPFMSAKEGLSRSFEFSKLILSALGKMGTDLFSSGKIPTDVAGPIGIVHEVSKQKVFASGFLRALDFTAMFSINLAIMNVLPIPALDGGRALFIFLEFFVGRRRVAKIEQHANSFGIVLLLFFIVLISVKDVWMLFR